MITRLTLPPRYGLDAFERLNDGNGHGVKTLVRATARYIVLDVDDDALFDLESDAEYYSDPTGFDESVRGLCRSAKAALVILRGVAELRRKAGRNL